MKRFELPVDHGAKKTHVLRQQAPVLGGWFSICIDNVNEMRCFWVKGDVRRGLPPGGLAYYLISRCLPAGLAAGKKTQGTTSGN
ncbi:hypothetical protein [Musicola paradisiaca]|uniref:hypothetical protein n=1 Tax=Musicola paradisiaca TaxID=69223 RepID=UPI0012DF7BCB|nr:hypothetical protein [Musicola paradisiaca]